MCPGLGKKSLDWFLHCEMKMVDPLGITCVVLSVEVY